MKTYKELIEQINKTLYLSEGPTHLEYGGYVGKKEYTVKVPQHKELGDYSDKGLHRKISKENPHLHHHEVTAIVNSGGEEESHEKVEHEGKTHTHHVINYQEPRHLYNEEFEDLDEANENFDSNSKAHQAAKKAAKGWRGVSKATYHPDGSATINTKEVTKNRHGKHGHYSGLETTHSHWAVSAHLRDAGGEWGHSRDDLDNHKQKIDGLHWKVKGKIVRGVGRTHEIHIHEGVEGLDELSRETVRTYYNKAIAQGKPIADKMKVGGGDWSKDGQDTKTLKKRGAGVTMALKRRRGEVKMSEEFDFDLFESIMLGEGDLSIRTLYNKYADHALGAGDSPEPKKAAAVKKAIVKVHGATVMGHLEKAKNAAAKNDQDSESNHFNNARNSAKTDTMSATVGKNRSSMRKEEVDLEEGRMKDLAMDMESLSHADFKRKHRRTKQQMQDALKSEELKGNQHKIDANKNGKVDGHDFKILRNQKKARYQ